MAINTLATATLFMTQLDKIAIQEATTGWMDRNAGQVIYNGGAEVKIPKMNVQGMGDYDRENGYQRGSVTLEYETRKMTQDRGRLFQIDPMDINETNFIPTAGAIMGEFQRTQVVPEIDAYRISKLATETLTANKAGMIGESYVPGTTGTSALRKFKEGIKAVRDSYNGALVCQATPEFIMELELELAGKIEDTTFSKGGIDTRVPAVDHVPLIPTSSNRMYTAIKINDGKTAGQEKGGYEKGASAKNLNFFICPATTPIAVTKQDIMESMEPWMALTGLRLKGESGPELVGKMGNRSAVANNNQIIAGIRAGVFEAVVNAFESMQGSSNRGQEIRIYLEGDAKKLFKMIRQEGNNYQKQTGNPVFG